MPAPKKFNPAPTPSPSYTTRRSSDTAKGRHAIVPQLPKPRIDDEEPVEISVDEVTVVMGSVSKYQARSLHAHVEPGLSIEIDEFDEAVEVAESAEPVRPAPTAFGEWRTESTLEGTHYHRKDSRRT